MKKIDRTNVATYFTEDELKIFRKYNMSDDDIRSLLLYFSMDPLAAVVWFQKYADKEGGETTPDDMHMRLAYAFSEVESDNIINEKEIVRENTKEYIKVLSKGYRNRKHMEDADIFASMHRFEHIIPQGSIMAVLGTPTLGSISNCIVVDSPHDSYAGIFKTDQELAQLMKMRCGVGVDITTLRPEGTEVNNFAKTSSGAVSFMERFSNTTREVSQGSRRGALMLSISVLHPDIEKFIAIKQDLSKVTGANISVRVTDDFMEAVENDKEYCLRWPEDVKVPNERKSNEELGQLIVKRRRKGSKLKTYKMYKWIKAKDVWDKLVKAAHASAEPGILFWSAIKFADPAGAYPEYAALSTNPCGEIPLPANDSCRLVALNLFGFVENAFEDDVEFNYHKFYRTTYDAMRLSDNVVDLELYRIANIIDKIDKDDTPKSLKEVERGIWEKLFIAGKNGRRTGLGFTGLGDVAAAFNLPYGSYKFLEIIKRIMKKKIEAELDATIDMAILRGPFKGWNPDNEFLEIDGKLFGMNSFFQMLCDEFPEQAEKMYRFGRRNVSWSTVAPTGTLSMLAHVTSGIEPLFSPYYKRRKKLTTDAEDYDFIDDKGDKWTEHNVVHYQFKKWIEKVYVEQEGINWVAVGDVENWSEDMLENAFVESPWYGSTANDISPGARVAIQATVQRYTTHSISSTVNLPKDVKVTKVNKIYMDGWKAGLKGITVYRDGSRDGILITPTSTKEQQKFGYKNSIKRPKKVRAIAYTTQVGPDKYSIFVGEIEGLPYEVFAYKGGTKEGVGWIVKEAKGEYYFIGEEEGSKQRIITNKMTDEQEIITRLISGSLRHGRDIKFIVGDLQKTSGSLFSFNSAIARILKKYIIDGEVAHGKCPQCGDDNVIYEEGCKKCNSCGWSAC